MSKCNLPRAPHKNQILKPFIHFGHYKSDEKLLTLSSRPEFDILNCEYLEPELTPPSQDAKIESKYKRKTLPKAKEIPRSQSHRMTSPKSILKKTVGSESLILKLNSPKRTDCEKTSLEYISRFSPSTRSQQTPTSIKSTSDREMSQTTDSWNKFSRLAGPIIDRQVLYSNLKNRIMQAHQNAKHKLKRVKSPSPAKSVLSPVKSPAQVSFAALQISPRSSQNAFFSATSPRSSQNAFFSANSPSSTLNSSQTHTRNTQAFRVIQYTSLSPHNRNYGFECGFDYENFLKRSRPMN